MDRQLVHAFKGQRIGEQFWLGRTIPLQSSCFGRKVSVGEFYSVIGLRSFLISYFEKTAQSCFTVNFYY